MERSIPLAPSIPVSSSTVITCLLYTSVKRNLLSVKKERKMKNNAKAILWQNGIFYLTGMLIILGIKLFYSKASVPDLKWILAPTSLWVRILSGIPFDYEPGSGYVSHSFRFIIAPSCSGVQFMLIAAATLLYSFVHRMPTRKKGIYLSLIHIYLPSLYRIGI